MRPYATNKKSLVSVSVPVTNIKMDPIRSNCSRHPRGVGGGEGERIERKANSQSKSTRPTVKDKMFRMPTIIITTYFSIKT